MADTESSLATRKPTRMELLSRVRFEPHRHHRAKFGFIVLAMEQTAEEDLYRTIPQGIGVHFSRVPMANEARVDALIATREHLPGAAKLLLPFDQLDVLSYTCTAASLLLGEEETTRLLASGGNARKVVTAAGASVRALRAVQAKRVVAVTPYGEQVNRALIDRLAFEGIETLELVPLPVKTNIEVDSISPEYLRALGLELLRQHPSADALYFCCGAMRSIEAIEAVERESGRPVIASNQAILWDCLRQAGLMDRLPGLGMLLANS